VNDNNILACIEFAKQERLACAGDALRDYKKLISPKASRPTKRATDGFKRSPNCTCDTRPHAPWCVDSKKRRC